MKIFNQDKTQEIFNPDLQLGYLSDDKIQVGMTEAVPYQEEVGHYEVDKEYFNDDGTLFGVERKWVIDTPAVERQPSDPIYEDIKVYIPFSDDKIAEIKESLVYDKNKAIYDELNDNLEYLRSTDHKVLQFFEGALDVTTYQSIKAKRSVARLKVRGIERILDNLKSEMYLNEKGR